MDEARARGPHIREHRVPFRLGVARPSFGWLRDRTKLLFGVVIRHPTAAGLLGLLCAIALVLSLRVASELETLELLTYDGLVRLRSQGTGVDGRVTLIAISESDLQRFGWPLSDGSLAQIVQKLREAHSRAIGIDIYRPTPIGPGTDALAQTIAETPQLVWVERFSEDTWSGIAPPAAAKAAGKFGFSDVVLDPGGVARRGLLYLNDEKRWDESLSLKLALAYLAAEGLRPAADSDQWLRLGQVSLPALDERFGGYVDLDARGYQILREFRAPARLAEFSLSDLFDGRVPLDRLRDRIVLVGVSADSVKDFMQTPLDTKGGHGTPGSMVHGLFAAQLLQHALDGVRPTRPLPRAAELLLIVAVGICGAGMALTLRGVRRLTLVTVIGIVVSVGGSYAAFLKGIWLPLLPIGGTWVLAAVMTAMGVTFAENAQRALLMRLFSAHVSAPIAREIWRRRVEIAKAGRPIPMRLTATVLFSDINDFTTHSETLEPETLVHWLNMYMEAMTDLIDEHGGVIERFAGDAIMVMFGVPITRHTPAEIANDAAAAVKCAISMGEALQRLNRRWADEGLPTMQIAVGIYSGDLVSCALGSAARQQYTVIGDTTNTAARLVNVAKDVMKANRSNQICGIVVGGTTHALLEERFLRRPLGKFALKGKAQQIDCYEIAVES